jgi:DNA-binding PadR family transcriptional regulator
MRHDSSDTSTPFWHWHSISRQEDAILKTLEKKPRTSQEIVKILRKVLEISLTRDSIYSVLRGLASKGLIQTRKAPVGKANIHKLTKLGREAISHRARQWEQLANEGLDFEQNLQT